MKTDALMRLIVAAQIRLDDAPEGMMKQAAQAGIREAEKELDALCQLASVAIRMHKDLESVAEFL